MPNQPLLNTVIVSIVETVGQPARQVADIPWYAGMTALSAMILADAMTEPAGHRGTPQYQHDTDFSFRVVYSSMFGAFVDQIGGMSASGGKFWMLYVFPKGSPEKASPVGVSEALLVEDGVGQTVVVEWRFEIPTDHPASVKSAALAKELKG